LPATLGLDKSIKRNTTFNTHVHELRSFLVKWEPSIGVNPSGVAEDVLRKWIGDGEGHL
jgi:hypothetical protein